MGYGVMAYSTDLESVRRSIGGSNENYAKFLGGKFNAGSTSLNKEIKKITGGGKNAPKARDLARQMLLGEPLDDRLGFAYAYFLEYLCRTVYGKALPNDAWYPSPTSFPEQVDEGLAAAGVPEAARFAEALVWGGPPVPLPVIEDFPMIGWLDREEIAAKLPDLEAAELSRIDDPGVRAAVEQGISWLREARAANRALVCFRY